MNSTKPTRREFLLLVTVGASTMGLAACGGGSNNNSDMAGGSNDCSTVNTVIGANHGHSTITIPESDVTAAADKTYTLMGLAHMHSFTLTPTDFADLDAGKSVSKTTTVATSGAAHMHAITIRCTG